LRVYRTQVAGNATGEAADKRDAGEQRHRPPSRPDTADPWFDHSIPPATL